MAVPKVKLRNKKDKNGTTYFLDYTVKGKRHRPAVGTNKKTALEICQNVQAKLSLGQFDIYSHPEKTISLQEITQNFLSSKRNHIRPSSLKRYQNYLDKYNEYMGKYFPAPSLNIREIKTNFYQEREG
jgi:hypothetical protein